jgi:hypothetical protein
MSGRSDRFALVLLFLLTAAVFLPALLRREVFVTRDHFDYFQPLRYFTAEELKSGSLPLWNPYSASGEPWLANPQTGVFYPPAWLFLILPFATAYVLYLFAHLLLLGWGSYLFFTRFASGGAAMVGAGAVLLSGPVISLLDVSNNLATLAWLPLALWCAASGAWRRGGLVLALAFLAGEPFFAALAALLYVAVRRHRDLVGTALIAIGASAVQLFPFLEFVGRSDRAGGMSDALILHDSMPLTDWWRLALPPEVARRVTGAVMEQQFIPLVYVGVVIILLALAGALRSHRSAAARASLVLLILAAAIATGPLFLTQLPLTIFRYPARLIPVAAIAIGALAAVGWNSLRPGPRWADLLLLAVIAFDLFHHARPLLATTHFSTDVVPYSAVVGKTAKVLRFGEIDPLRRAEWMSGYLNLYERRFDEFTAAPLVAANYAALHRRILLSPTFLDVARTGVAFIITPYDLPEPWTPVHVSEGLYIYRNPEAWPMAAHFSPGGKAMRHARWELDTSSARVVVNAPTDGVLVLRQQAAPGWRVTVDGVPARPLVIDGIFRGVNLAAGRHEVVWRYRPPALIAGAAMTLVTLLALQILLFVKRHRRRQSAENFSSFPSNVQ